MTELGTEDRLLNVGGHRVAVRVSGAGAPPVVCLSSLGGAHEQWERFVPLMQSVTTCITYGRPGLDGSDPLPADTADAARSGSWAAGHLRNVLEAAGLAPPYVFVTGSIGAFIADQYAARRPDEVAGLVLIDPTYWTPVTGLVERDDLSSDDPGGIQFSRQGCYTEMTDARPGIRGRSVVLTSAIGRWLRVDPAQQPWLRPFSTAEFDQIWQDKQLEWVERLDAVQVIADTADHHVHLDQPDLAAHVACAVVAAAREGRDVRLDATSVAAAGGRLTVVGSGGMTR